MGDVSSASGLSLVVPAYFVCAGILIFTAVTAAVVGLHRTRVPLYLTFSLTCFVSAFGTAAMASYYLADSVAGAVEALRWAWTAGALLVGVIFWFVAVYTGARNVRIPALLMGAFVAAFIVANHLLPLGARFERIEGFGWIHLPWGESIFRLHGPTTEWLWAFRGASVVTVVWSLRELVIYSRRGNLREAAFLATYLVVLFASSVHGALIDAGVIHTPHSIGIVLVGLSLLMGVHLVMRLREQNEELRELAYRDPLTGLPNRIFAQERIATMIAAGAGSDHGAVILLDIDHFKVINDGLTHEVGDQVLRDVARRLQETAAGRALVVRMGGDAFMGILENLVPGEIEALARAEALARELAHSLARPAGQSERTMNLYASFGIAAFGAAATATEVLGRADMALHRAKKRGRNNIQSFRPALHEEASERFRILEGLRNAVEADELSLHYQPVVDRAGLVIGAEALMRWSSKALGNVSPAAFIPVAEETGLIHSLGEWSLRHGCERLAEWRRSGAPFAGRLSINVSPWQLARPDFVERLGAVVGAAGVDPGLITLEITETAVLFDVDEAVAKLRDIRPTGVRIALDDFGTGYSSLALIKDLPLDAIKIDQSFVRHLNEGANQHLIRVIVAIGSELGLDVIAEGVETAADRDLLLHLGCDKLQGYLFSRPLPEKEFLAWLASRAARPMAVGVTA